jgi:hypothetical protein
MTVRDIQHHLARTLGTPWARPGTELSTYDANWASNELDHFAMLS